jgi:hypothetical protein
VNGTTFALCAAVLLPAAALPACATGAKGDGLAEVNELVGAIERVHTNSELAQERVHLAVRELMSLMVFDFSGDAVSAYAAFATAVDESTRHLDELRESIESMKESSEPVFTRWAEDLDSFKSMEMRLRSQSRLKETRERYDAVVSAAELALAGYDTLNVRLCDYSVYLGNDFNASSVAAIQGDVRSLDQVVSALDQRFDQCQEAARVYIDAAALPMTLPPAQEGAPKAAPKGSTKRAPRRDG